MKPKLGLRRRWLAPYAVLCLILGTGMVLVGCQTGGGGGGDGTTNTNTANDNVTNDNVTNDNVTNDNVTNDNVTNDNVTNDNENDNVECTTNADCDDGDFCNGAETCVSNACQPGTNPCEADETCDEATDTCVGPPQLFVVNFLGVGQGRVTSYLNPATAVGDIPHETRLQGNTTNLNFPRDAVINTAGNLVVVNQSGQSITTYTPDRWDGDNAPNGSLSGGNTDLDTPRCLTYNPTDDLLFVSDSGDNEIEVYANTAAVLNGNVAPTRRINSASLNGPRGVFFGDNDRLYVANQGAGNVLVFNNASTLNANVAPTAILTNANFTTVWDVWVDSADNLFVVNQNGTIVVFQDAASLATGDAHDSLFSIQGAVFAIAMVVDSNDTGYIADFTADTVYVYDNVSTLNSLNVVPDRTIGSGANTNSQINAPVGLWLEE